MTAALRDLVLGVGRGSGGGVQAAFRPPPPRNGKPWPGVWLLPRSNAPPPPPNPRLNRRVQSGVAQAGSFWFGRQRVRVPVRGVPGPQPAAVRAPLEQPPRGAGGDRDEGAHRCPRSAHRCAGFGGRGCAYPWGGGGGAVDRGVWTAKTVKRPRQQPAHPQYANYWAPLTRKRHIPPHPAQPRHTNDGAPRTRKRHQQEHRPQRPTESSDPTQHAKGRTGDCAGPRKGTSTRRNVTQGGGGGGQRVALICISAGGRGGHFHGQPSVGQPPADSHPTVPAGARARSSIPCA